MTIHMDVIPGLAEDMPPCIKGHGSGKCNKLLHSYKKIYP